MMPSAIVIFVLLTIGVFIVPKRYVPILYLIGSLYNTSGQYIVIGGAHLYVARLLILLIVLRFLMRNEIVTYANPNITDLLFLLWAIFRIVPGIINPSIDTSVAERIGRAIDTLGSFYIFKICIGDFEDVKLLCVAIIYMFIPIAICMIYEKITSHNLFYYLGGVNELSEIRNGKIRAQGTFSHSILAGTTAAALIPLILSLKHAQPEKKWLGRIGFITLISIVIASTSSGPILTVATGLLGLFMWRYRDSMRGIRWFILLSLIGLEIVMKAHVWYLISRIDLTGSSTGYFRSELITQAFIHLSEWWLYGTNYTRHWMPTGVPWSENHTDIVNFYIGMGVAGGLPLMITFICIIVGAYKHVGRVLQSLSEESFYEKKLVWALGSVLFAHTLSFLSVSYFDQSANFFYMIIGILARLDINRRVHDLESADIIDNSNNPTPVT